MFLIVTGLVFLMLHESLQSSPDDITNSSDLSVDLITTSSPSNSSTSKSFKIFLVKAKRSICPAPSINDLLFLSKNHLKNSLFR